MADHHEAKHQLCYAFSLQKSDDRQLGDIDVKWRTTFSKAVFGTFTSAKSSATLDSEPLRP